MKCRSERGQVVVVLVLLIGLVIAVAMLGLAGSMGGMKKGADTIGNSVGNAIDNAITPYSLYMSWKGSQALFPNKHSVERHGADAWAATDCYNRNGAFHVVKTSFDGIHLLCQDNDGSVRDIVLEQKGKSNKFEMKSAFTPQGGKLQDVLAWVGRKIGANKFTMPNDAVIYIDGIAP